jgi:hypothetical protein
MWGGLGLQPVARDLPPCTVSDAEETSARNATGCRPFNVQVRPSLGRVWFGPGGPEKVNPHDDLLGWQF